MKIYMFDDPGPSLKINKASLDHAKGSQPVYHEAEELKV